MARKDVAEELGISDATARRKLGLLGLVGPDDQRNGGGRGTPAMISSNAAEQLRDALMVVERPAGLETGLVEENRRLVAEVAELRVQMQVMRDSQAIDAIAAQAELLDLKRKYKALAQLVAIDAGLEVDD